MPEQLTRDDGSTVQVYTAEEVEAAKTEAASAAEAAAAPVKAELETAKAELSAAQEKLSKANDKDLNFGALRQAKEELENKVKTLETQVPDMIRTAQVQAYVEEATERLAQGDKDLAAKIKIQFERLKSASDTKEEAAKKLRDAYTLAQAGEPTGPDPLMSIISSAGAGPQSSPRSDTSSKPLNEIQKAVASKLGITDEDVKKYNK
jgi:DNA repair exonuclease SbcCD ATPase subunit